MNNLRLHLWLKLLTVRLRIPILLYSFCKECGRTVHDFRVADELWDKVDPLIKHGHVLCYDCFCEKCRGIGLPTVWRLVPLE